MRRPVALAMSAVVLAAGAGSAVVAAQASNGADDGHSGRRFVGYWMGIDPLDGGDSRRGITRNENRTFSMIGRDTVFTLCDGTDRAVVTANGATAVGSALVSDRLVITCSNTGREVTLKVRYDIIDRNVIRETITTRSGDPVDEIIFHRVSEG